MDGSRVQFIEMGVNKKDPRIWDAYFSRHKLSLIGRWVTHLLCLHKNYSPPFQYAKLHIYEVIIVTCHRFFHPFFTVSTAASGREKKSHVARKITFYWKCFGYTFTMICFIKCIMAAWIGDWDFSLWVYTITWCCYGDTQTIHI